MTMSISAEGVFAERIKALRNLPFQKAAAPVCQRCSKPIAGPRAMMCGLNSGDILVCGFCTTVEEHNRYLAELQRRQEADD